MRRTIRRALFLVIALSLAAVLGPAAVSARPPVFLNNCAGEANINVYDATAALIDSFGFSGAPATIVIQAQDANHVLVRAYVSETGLIGSLSGQSYGFEWTFSDRASFPPSGGSADVRMDTARITMDHRLVASSTDQLLRVSVSGQSIVDKQRLRANGLVFDFTVNILCEL